MEDASGQPFLPYDLVEFQASTTTGGAAAYHGRAEVFSAVPRKKKIVVVHVDGTMEAKNPRDLTVVDRPSLCCPGMLVTSASDPGGQAGVVTAAATALDLVQLHILTGDSSKPRFTAAAVATDVPPAELRRPVTELVQGDYVVSGPWLGRVLEVTVDVAVRFDDGSVCRVAGAGDKLRAVFRNDGRRRLHGLFPGQRVGGRSDAVFRTSRWLKGYWKPSHGEGTVARVETRGVLVYWVASSVQGADRAVVQAAAPPAYQPSPHNLTFFCAGDLLGRWIFLFGDPCFFRTPATAGGGGDRSSSPATVTTRPDAAAGGQTAAARLSCKYRIRNMGKRRRLAEIQRPMSVADTRTMVDVLWQDGTRQRRVASASLLPFPALNEHDFFPGERVVATTSALAPPGDDDDAVAATRVGVVRSVNYKDQTVLVSWITAPGEVGGGDDMVSAYDIRWSSDHDFLFGDIVVRLRPGESGGEGDRGRSRDPEETARPTRRKKKTAAAHDLSWVGHIVDLCDTHYFEVKWGDGSTTKVLPHEIAFVRKRSFEEMLHEMHEDDWVHDDDDQDKAIGTAQEDNPEEPLAPMGNNGAAAESGDDSDDDAEDGAVPAARTTGRAGSVIEAVIRTVGQVLAHCKSYLVRRNGDGEAKEAAAAVVALAADDNGGDVPTGEMKAGIDATGGEKLFRFPHFDVVQSPEDHHYLDSKEKATSGGKKWLKRVQKEWKILENNLPDTVYVQAFEDRMDLLRAVMVGAAGTPYQDGLFFFDLQLPLSSFPAAPPLVNYRSFGLRVNPNLYPSGTVCLSLLNTFGGEGAELWSPESSTVLQVVVSIQGLVLTARPYYNEAGYEVQAGTPEGRRNELPYAENAFLLNLKTMMHVLRQPPAGFEEFVEDHFRRRGRLVLRACQAYLGGCPVGTLDDEACATEASSGERPCSAGFRLALANVAVRLAEALAGIGAEGCDDLLHHLRRAPLCGNNVSSGT